MNNEDQDRWRALAEELGLAADEKPESTTKGKSAARRASPAPDPGRQEPPAVEVGPEEAQTAEPTAEQTDLPPLEKLDEPVLTRGENRLTVEDVLPEAAPQPEEPGRRGRGRRRGRRGRRGERAAEGSPEQEATQPLREAGAEQEEPQHEVDEEPQEEPGERVRRRGGRRQHRDVDAEDFDEPEESVEEENAHDEEDEAYDELLANWNVPSWSEIIGSLYRPDR